MGGAAAVMRVMVTAARVVVVEWVVVLVVVAGGVGWWAAPCEATTTTTTTTAIIPSSITSTSTTTITATTSSSTSTTSTSTRVVPSPIRISVYGRDPDASSFISITRPRRNATFVSPSSEIKIGDQKVEMLDEEEQREIEEAEDMTGEAKNTPHTSHTHISSPFSDANAETKTEHVDTDGVLAVPHAPVNRMGLASEETSSASSRRLRVHLRESSKRRRSQSIFNSTRGAPAPLPPSIRPPAPPPKPPSFGPPAPPVSSPAPPSIPLPPSTPVPTSFGPPSIPPPISSPSPPPGSDEAQVTDIKCMDTGSTSSFMAVLSLPLGYNAIPVFEDRPNVDPTINTACRMIPTQLTNDMFQLIVSDLERCGVTKCRQPTGETWLCLQLRFPLVNGLKLPEDEIIHIRCRPQDKTAQDTHVLRVATAKYAAKDSITGLSSASVFEGGQQEFQCEIGLFRKLPGTELFASIVTPEVELDLGEEVQLRSIVRAGDGWQYSRITTIIIQKVGAPRSRSILNAADLVFADGCRNPSYKVIAKQHPKRDPRNPLINNFTFRMFMFQDMQAGDTLMITANVIGCVDAQDCAPANCVGAGEDDLLGFGRRRRAVSHTFTTVVPVTLGFPSTSTGPPFPPPVTTFSSSTAPSPPPLPADSASYRQRANTTNWERNLSVRVKIPDDEVQQESLEAQECRLYLFITLGVSAAFCISSVVFVLVTLLRGRSKNVSQPSPPVAVITPPPPGPQQQQQQQYLFPVCPSPPRPVLADDAMSVHSGSPLHDFPVPPTVRHRKRQVNTELLSIFNNEHHQYPCGGYFPGMLNYYGYVVVPRRPSDKTRDKKTRAVRRDRRRHRTSEAEKQHEDMDSHLSGASGSHVTAASSGGHKSIIRVSGRRSEMPKNACSTTRSPKPLPRSSVHANDENIYSEIPINAVPTLV